MIIPKSDFFSYALVRYADPLRDEHLNVGAVLVDHGGSVLWRFDDDLRRVAAAFPGVPAQHLRKVLGEAEGAFDRLVHTEGLSGLDGAARDWQNLLRISPVRSVRAPDASSALQKVFVKYVAPPDAAEAAEIRHERQPRGTTYTSRTLVRGLKVRLQRRGLVEWEQFEVDARIEGYTRERRPVPVWYPIKVRESKLFDAFESSDNTRQTAWDAARLMSQKAQETLRGEGRYSVMFTIRGRDRSELPDELAAMLREEGAVNGYKPDVEVIREIDELDRVAKDLGGRGPLNLFDDTSLDS